MRPQSNMCEYTPSWYVRFKQTTVRFLGMYIFDENKRAIRVLSILHAKLLYAFLTYTGVKQSSYTFVGILAIKAKQLYTF